MNFKNTARALAIASALALTAGTGMAYASINVSGTSDTTGPFSENDNLYEVERNLTIDLENIADVFNGIDFAANSGDNIVDNNTTVRSVNGGDIRLSVRLENDLNRNSLSKVIPNTNNRISASFRNGTTGPNSINDNVLNVEKNSAVNVLNEADIDNNLILDLNTGVNDVDFNTTVGSVTTGDIDVTSNIRSSANTSSSTVMWSSLNGTDSDVTSSFRNNVTGPNSENINTLDVEDNTSIEITNNASIDNQFDILANTGSNDTVNNTTVGSVGSGDISVSIVGVSSAN